MELRSTRIIDAAIDQVWALQLAHDQWPTHLPNFTRVVRAADGAPFGLGSTATITQPGLGSLGWTVVRFDEQPGERSFAWVARSRGMHFEASHEAVAHGDHGTRLTLGLRVGGPMGKVIAPVMKGRMQRTIDAESVAFEQWAAAVSAP